MKTLLWLTLGGSVLALFLFALRRLVLRKMPSTVYYYAWLLVLLRFALPVPGLLTVPTPTPAAPAAVVAQAAPISYAQQSVGATEERQAQGAEQASDAQSVRSETAARAEARTRTETNEIVETKAPAAATAAVKSENPALALLRSLRFWLCLWAVGSLASLFFTAGAYSCYCFSLRQSFRKPDAETARIYASFPGRKPALWVCSACKTPLMYGVFFPKIVLPAFSYDEELLRNVFSHELMHYRRRDPLYKWISVWILATQWFNPLSYLIRRELDRSCELSCDEMLLQSMTGHEKKSYGNALLSMAAVGALPHGVVATAFATEKKNLKERLVQIMTYKKSATRIVAALLAVLLLAGCGLAAGPSDSKNDKEENDNDIYYAATPEELVAAIGSNRTIVLTGTNYDLNTAENQSSQYCMWEEVGDGNELVIRNVSELTIQAGDGKDCMLQVLPRQANVLRFENCGHITLSGLTIGHVKQAEACQGSVLALYDCLGVTVNDCRLYGCGTFGVVANNVSDMLLKKTEIYECSVGSVDLNNCSRVSFEDCSIHDVPENSFSLFACEKVTWNDSVLDGYASYTMDENGVPSLVWRYSDMPEEVQTVDHEGEYDLTEAAYQPTVDENGVYYAENAGQLLNAIGPDRTVVLTGERYDLSELRWCDTAYCSWREVFDGEELVIGDLSNLTIRCEDSAKDACLLEVLPRYANVLCFENCENVTLFGFTAGHVKERGLCRGGVLYFEDCENMTVDSCHLFGCGTYGVISEGVRGLTVENTEIYECSEGAVMIERTRDASFLNCDVHDVPENPLGFGGCSNVTWNDMVLDHDNNNPYFGFELDENGNPVSRNGEWVTAAEAEAQQKAQEQTANLGSYEVETVDELVEALGPDRVITLKGDSFVLSKSESYQQNGFSAYYYWSEEFDGKTLVIRNLSGLTIRAETEDPHDLTIETLPRYADVLRFEDCEDLTLSGFTAGHIKEKGECTGGVLSFVRCNKITVDGCSLYGCGTFGVISKGSEEISVLNTEIYECSYGAMTLSDTSGVTVKDCNIHDMPTETFNVWMDNVKHVVWEEKSMQSVESGGFNVDEDGRLQ